MPFATLAANVLLHVAVLFGLLTALFLLFIRGVTQHHIDKQVRSAVRALVRRFADGPTREHALRWLAASGGGQRIARELRPGSLAVRINNRWARAAMLAAAAALGLAAAVALLAVPRADAAHLLALNACVFAGVALVEGAFFKVVALQFVPVLPSTLQTMCAQQLNAQLHGAGYAREE